MGLLPSTSPAIPDAEAARPYCGFRISRVTVPQRAAFISIADPNGKARNWEKRTMDTKKFDSHSRRELIRNAALGGGAAAVLGGLGINPLIGAAMAKEAGKSSKPLKAAFSNAGLQATWCAQGKQAAEYWGSLFNVEVTWFDGQLDAVKQRSAIDNMASQKWDFVAIQADGIGTLTAPVNKMIDAGIPVIDMDTLIAPLDTINVHALLAPDNEFMGASVTLQSPGCSSTTWILGNFATTDLKPRARPCAPVWPSWPCVITIVPSPLIASTSACVTEAPMN